MKSDYNLLTASEETIQAMKDRCAETSHVFENCCTSMFNIYQRCKWCGEVK